MKATRLLVTGASGRLARKVVELLVEQGVAGVIATTRSPEMLSDWARSGAVEVRHADFDDDTSLADAFRGAARALLVSTDACGIRNNRSAQQARAVAALEDAGVGHVVYTSLQNPHGSLVLGASDHAATEAALAASAMDFTVLRNNLYADGLLPILRSAQATGVLVDTRDDGAIAYVTRDDCAHAAAAALLDEGSRGRFTFDVTGPEALTGDQVAALASDVCGREVTRYSVPFETLVFSLMEDGLTECAAKTLASYDLSARRGELASTADTVRLLTGRPPGKVRDFLLQHRDALVDASSRP